MAVSGTVYCTLKSKTHILPVVIPEVLVVDYVSSISGLSFIDLDLDPEELGGYITWIPPGFLGSMVEGNSWQAFIGGIGII